MHRVYLNMLQRKTAWKRRRTTRRTHQAKLSNRKGKACACLAMTLWSSSGFHIYDSTLLLLHPVILCKHNEIRPKDARMLHSQSEGRYGYIFWPYKIFSGPRMYGQAMETSTHMHAQNEHTGRLSLEKHSYKKDKALACLESTCFSYAQALLSASSLTVEAQWNHREMRQRNWTLFKREVWLYFPGTKCSLQANAMHARLDGANARHVKPCNSQAMETSFHAHKNNTGVLTEEQLVITGTALQILAVTWPIQVGDEAAVALENFEHRHEVTRNNQHRKLQLVWPRTPATRFEPWQSKDTRCSFCFQLKATLLRNETICNTWRFLKTQTVSTCCRLSPIKHAICSQRDHSIG